MENYLRKFSGMVFIVALNLSMIVLLSPLQGWSHQVEKNLVLNDYGYQHITGAIASSPATPISLGKSERALAGINISGPDLSGKVPTTGGQSLAENSASPAAKNQQMFLILLLMASANKYNSL